MKKIFFILIIFCLVSSYFLCTNTYAVMKGLSTEKLTRSSEMVVRGEVKEVKSYWSDDGKTIFTSATISIRDIIRGKLVQKTIVVEYPGGQVGDIGLKVSDVATFKKGEQILLFLKPAKNKRAEAEDIYNIVGRAQGKYTIDSDGIAKKRGFSLADGKDAIDNNIPVDKLIEKIKGIK